VKKTMSRHEMVESLMADEYANWTRLGAYALVEWLEALEEDTGTEMEWDRVAIRCDFTEYPSALAAAAEYGITASDEESARLMLEDRTAVIRIPESSGVIIQQY